MNWSDYMLRVKRNSYRERDDWGWNPIASIATTPTLKTLKKATSWNPPHITEKKCRAAETRKPI